MNLNNLIFTDQLPKLDLHGYDRDSARVAINDFIRDARKQKIQFLQIVHGRGSGILRNTTHEVLRQNKEVIEYKMNYYNDGCTLVHVHI